MLVYRWVYREQFLIYNHSSFYGTLRVQIALRLGSRFGWLIRKVLMPVVIFSMLRMGWLKLLMFAPVVILKGWLQLEWNHLLLFFRIG